MSHWLSSVSNRCFPTFPVFTVVEGRVLTGVASERFDFRQVVEKRSHLLQIQVLGITQRPGAEIAAKLGVCRQAVFKHFVALAESGAHFRQVMLRQHGASDLHPGLFQLYVKVDPGLVVDGAVVSDDLQFHAPL